MSPEPTPAEEITDVEQQGAPQGAPADTPPPAPPAPPAPEPPAPVAEQPPVTAGAAAPPPAPPAVTGPLPATPAPQAIAPSEPKVMDAEWPHPGYTGPQPWEADNPPTLTQNHLMLGSGAAGEEVVELASHLAYLGYGLSISVGQNPHQMFDDSIRAAVAAFCSDYGVAEDPKVLQARTQDTVGPWLWEALVRAVHKKAAEAPPGQEA